MNPRYLDTKIISFACVCLCVAAKLGRLMDLANGRAPKVRKPVYFCCRSFAYCIDSSSYSKSPVIYQNISIQLEIDHIMERRNEIKKIRQGIIIQGSPEG